MTYDPALPYTRSELLSPEWFGTVDLEDHQVRGPAQLLSSRGTFVFYGGDGGGVVAVSVVG